MHITKWKTWEVTYYTVRFQLVTFWKGKIIMTWKVSGLLGVWGERDD